MAIEFKLPELGENIESGDLVRVIVSPGAQVNEGDPVIELETDKAVIEVPSTIAGTVSEVKVKQGDKVKVGQVIFTLAEGKAAETKAAPAAKAEPAAAPAQQQVGAAAQRRNKNSGTERKAALRPERKRNLGYLQEG